MTADHESFHPNLGDALEGEGLNDDLGHLTAAELTELDVVAAGLATFGVEDDELEPLPGDLWSRIEAEALGPVVTAAAPSTPVESPDLAASPAEVVSLRPRRQRVVLAALAAAAAVVAVVGFVTTRGDDAEPITEQVVLEPLPGFDDAAGTATLVIDGDQRTVSVDLQGAEIPADHHLELWLLDEEVTEIISLGAIEGGEHTIPGEVDLSTTPVVDISLEPDDGDPAHSGISIVRGVVPT